MDLDNINDLNQYKKIQKFPPKSSSILPTNIAGSAQTI